MFALVTFGVHHEQVLICHPPPTGTAPDGGLDGG
jgi:hypothetical protein